MQSSYKFLRAEGICLQLSRAAGLRERGRGRATALGGTTLLCSLQGFDQGQQVSPTSYCVILSANTSGSATCMAFCKLFHLRVLLAPTCSLLLSSYCCLPVTQPRPTLS